MGGLCSNFLAKAPFKPPEYLRPLYERVGRPDFLDTGFPLYCFIKDTGSKFRLPEDPATPIILVGPGTGLAPMRGFLQQRSVCPSPGPCALFFGCRSDADYIYRDELAAFLERGTLSQLHIAFSRKEGVPKTYVQDLIQQEAANLWPLMSAHGCVYICGDAGKMAPAVKKAFTNMAASQGNLSPQEAADYVQQMQKEHRYCEDVWAST